MSSTTTGPTRHTPWGVGSTPRISWDRRVLWAVAAALASGAATLGLAEGVAERADLSRYDGVVTADVVAARAQPLTAVAQALSLIGSEVTVGLLTAGVLAWMVVRHRAWRGAWLFGSTMVVGGVVTLVVKHVLARSRPPAAVMMGPLDTGFSFPSGHTLYSTVFFGLVAGVLVQRSTRVGSRVAVALAWLLASGGVGLSRLYLGYHWLTDVLAGWSLGVVVLAVGAAAALLTRPGAMTREHGPA